jgi:Fur family iron response transcriptional regulator
MTDPVVDQLREHGIKPTSQRRVVAEVVLAREQHLTADQVLRRLRDQGHPVSRATVYNTLSLFARKGLVRELTIDPRRVVYDSNPRPHHHFYDVDTGELTDIPESSVELSRLPSLPKGARMDGVDVVVRVRRGRPRA